MDAELQFLYALAAIDEIDLSIKCPSGGQEAMKQYYNFKYFLMLAIDLFGQVSELQETLMILPISKVHPFGMILKAGKHSPDK